MISLVGGAYFEKFKVLIPVFTIIASLQPPLAGFQKFVPNYWICHIFGKQDFEISVYINLNVENFDWNFEFIVLLFLLQCAVDEILYLFCDVFV